jgi:hypothetical protein
MEINMITRDDIKHFEKAGWNEALWEEQAYCLKNIGNLPGGIGDFKTVLGLFYETHPELTNNDIYFLMNLFSVWDKEATELNKYISDKEAQNENK